MDSRVQQSIKFMEQNLSSNLTEKALAHHAGLTAQHFCVLFKTEIGESPKHYLNRLRMEKARELLEGDDQWTLSIKEVAAYVGCRDVSHFVRDFERRFGQSPRRYRAAR